MFYRLGCDKKIKKNWGRERLKTTASDGRLNTDNSVHDTSVFLNVTSDMCQRASSRDVTVVRSRLYTGANGVRAAFGR